MEIKYEIKTTANMKTLNFCDILVRLNDGKVIDEYDIGYKNHIKSKLIIDKINEKYCDAKVIISDMEVENEKYFSIKVPMLLSKKNETNKRNDVLTELIKMVHIIKTSNKFNSNELSINYLINKEEKICK